jgi:hypothetical protein
MWKNMVRPDSLLFACRVAKAGIQTHHHDIQYLTALQRQQWLRRRASAFCYTYIACLVLPFVHVGTDEVEACKMLQANLS